MNTNDEIEGVSPVEATIARMRAQANLVRAMAVCGAVAKLYRKRGQPPTWLHIEQPSNRHVKRRMSRTVRPIEYICNNCRLPFMGATRCQCKSAVKAREMVEVEA